jgi:hypothetical protein
MEEILKKYPEIEIKSINFNKYDKNKSMAFFIDGDFMIIGYINTNGVFKKFGEPISLKDYSEKTEQDYNMLMKTLPQVYSENMEQLKEYFNNAQISRKKQLDLSLLHKEKELYNVYLTDAETKGQNNITIIKKEYEEKIKVYLKEVEKIKDNKQKCFNYINTNKEYIISKIKENNEKMQKFLLGEKQNIKSLMDTNKKIKDEYKKIVTKLTQLLENQSGLSNNTTLSILEMKREMANNMNEMNKLKNNKDFLQKIIEKCNIKIKDEKETIIENIKTYKINIKEFISSQNNNNIKKFNDIKKNVLEEFGIILQSMEYLKKSDITNKDTIDKLNIKLNDTILKNILELKKKEEELKESCKVDNNILIEENKKLKEELKNIKELLKNSKVHKTEIPIDGTYYNKCYSSITNLITINNILSRKLEILKKIDKILETTEYDASSLVNFKEVKKEITNYITFMNLEKYINSPYISFLKNENTYSKIPQDFCDDIINILIYWNTNIKNFQKQSNILSNIYEDISNSVRVYIRLKPIFDKNVRKTDISINHNEKIMSFNKKNYGPFYDIYDESITTLDMYTGNTSGATDNMKNWNDEKLSNNELMKIEENDNALYSIFKQLSSGYNVVLFGYGTSGSGKTLTLLGQDGMPGLLHYGLSNLQNVKEIRIKNVFEQYANLINVNFNKINGKIYNIIGRIPKLKEVSKDTILDIKTVFLPEEIKELYSITQQIDDYRKTQKRIKKTPNNDNSSRSHLYYVFEIVFENNIKGYLTLIDSAGRESPTDIFNTYIDSTIVQLPSIMTINKDMSYNSIKKAKKRGTEEYSAETILEMLKESFYINETINHLIYYFNKKANEKMNVRLQPSGVDKYDIKKFYIHPDSEYNTVNVSNNCLTIPILQYIDNLQKKSVSKTKYIMLCMIRQEEKYIEQTENVLNFASSIKSS